MTAQPSKRVGGVGPTPCDLMLVASGPPTHADAKAGWPLMAGLDCYLDGVHLPSRASWWLTLLRQDYYRLKADRPVWRANECQDIKLWLTLELAECQPEVVVTLGYDATVYFLQPLDGSPLDLDEAYGNPAHSARHPFTVFPIYCPADGLAKPHRYPAIAQHFARLAYFLELA